MGELPAHSTSSPLTRPVVQFPRLHGDSPDDVPTTEVGLVSIRESCALAGSLPLGNVKNYYELPHCEPSVRVFAFVVGSGRS